jgi:activator of 2-hydroxyglutaryl-CoA dehydratase
MAISGSNRTPYRLGIDIGSATIKSVIVSDDEITRLTAGEPARERWITRGSHMTLDEAVLYALSHLPLDSA